MRIVGNYERDGYAHIERLIPEEVASAFLNGLKEDLAPSSIPLSQVAGHAEVLNGPAYEVYGPHYRPMIYFLLGLTPTIGEIVGRELLPSYDWFRVYRSGDVCRVHSDRPSCEHSLSLTLAYSDGAVWDFQVGKEEVRSRRPPEDDFGTEPFSSIAMGVGDAVLYRGVARRHGRRQPNPNAWSAHLFLHWVDRDGPYRDRAFEGGIETGPVSFAFT